MMLGVILLWDIGHKPGRAVLCACGCAPPTSSDWPAPVRPKDAR